MASETEQEKSYTERNREVDEASTKPETGLFDISPKQYKIGFYLILLGWIGYMFVKLQEFSHPADTLLPTILMALGIPLVVAKIAVIWRPEIAEYVMPDESGARGTVESMMGGDDIQRSKEEREKIEIKMALWIVLLPISIYYLGIGWAILIYSFAFSMYFIRDVRTSIINAAVIVSLAYVLFVKVLGILIWEGKLPVVRDLFFYMKQLF